MHKSWDVMYSMVTIAYNTVLFPLQVAERVDFKSSHHKKKTLCLVMEVS